LILNSTFLPSPAEAKLKGSCSDAALGDMLLKQPPASTCIAPLALLPASIKQWLPLDDAMLQQRERERTDRVIEQESQNEDEIETASDSGIRVDGILHTVFGEEEREKRKGENDIRKERRREKGCERET